MALALKRHPGIIYLKVRSDLFSIIIFYFFFTITSMWRFPLGYVIPKSYFNDTCDIFLLGYIYIYIVSIENIYYELIISIQLHFVYNWKENSKYFNSVTHPGIWTVNKDEIILRKII